MAGETGKRVVIVGGGFGGLAAALELGKRKVPVTLIDQRNYHLFQPLLYQVATAALSPADIAAPIRRILRKHRSVEVFMDEVLGVDLQSRTVTIRTGTIPYDRLILAAGSTHSYFGNEAWREHAPGLKTLEDATALRARLLAAFETAELPGNADARESLLTFVIVGGGPTGVELAGSIAELARRTLRRDFRNIDPSSARIILVEAGDRLLAGFDDRLTRYARDRLVKLGVDVRIGQAVEEIGHQHVLVAGERIPTSTVLWAAGVAAPPISSAVDAPRDRAGRITVNPDLSVAGHPQTYVIGDLALFQTPEGETLPGLAQVAKQQGRHLGKALAANLEEGTPLPPFRYSSRGNVAIIGRHAAVYEYGRYKMKGWLAWLLWAIVHVYLLVGFENRVLVCIQWLWRYVAGERLARLVTATGDRKQHANTTGDPREDKGGNG